MTENERIANEHGQMLVLLERVIDNVETGQGLQSGSGLVMAIKMTVDKIRNPPILMEFESAKITVETKEQDSEGSVEP